MELESVIAMLKKIGFSIRLSFLMMNHSDFIHTVEDVKNAILFGKQNGVDQTTLRPADGPDEDQCVDTDESRLTRKFIDNYSLTKKQTQAIVEYILENGTLGRGLAHGARVFSVKGQNVCLTNSALFMGHKKPHKNLIRELIFTPFGRLTDNWECPEAFDYL